MYPKPQTLGFVFTYGLALYRVYMDSGLGLILVWGCRAEVSRDPCKGRTIVSQKGRLPYGPFGESGLGCIGCREQLKIIFIYQLGTAAVGTIWKIMLVFCAWKYGGSRKVQ